MVYEFITTVGKSSGGCWTMGDTVTSEELGELEEKFVRQGWIVPQGSPMPVLLEASADPMQSASDLAFRLDAALKRAQVAETALAAAQSAPALPDPEAETLKTDFASVKSELEAAKTRLLAAEGESARLARDLEAAQTSARDADSRAQAAELRAQAAEEAVGPYLARNEELANQVEALSVTIETIIPSTDRGLDTLTSEQLQAILKHRGVDPIPEGKANLIAAVKQPVTPPAPSA